jgi:hypothetical protein
MTVFFLVVPRHPAAQRRLGVFESRAYRFARVGGFLACRAVELSLKAFLRLSSEGARWGWQLRVVDSRVKLRAKVLLA